MSLTFSIFSDKTHFFFIEPTSTTLFFGGLPRFLLNMASMLVPEWAWTTISDIFLLETIVRYSIQKKTHQADYRGGVDRQRRGGGRSAGQRQGILKMKMIMQ